ncbi:DUF6517 family protein [Halovenus sp. HT40]|uniref:DUF6517 family protein n=1 Tax=Halovenus sp. HT40 TaxID=3126691 RepID=UPI00300F4106
MTTRRQLVATLAGAATVSVAGCGLFTGSIEAEANPARVSENARSETGYTHQRTRDQTFEQTVSTGDQERDVSLTNWLSEYARTPSGAPDGAAGFLLFSTPTISVGGQSANPFEQFGEKRLIREVSRRSGRSEPDNDLEEVGTRSVDTLDQSVELTQYETTQKIGGQSVDIRIHVGSLTNDGDALVIVGSHPAPSQFGIGDESGKIDTLVRGIEHPTEP